MRRSGGVPRAAPNRSQVVGCRPANLTTREMEVSVESSVDDANKDMSPPMHSLLFRAERKILDPHTWGTQVSWRHTGRWHQARQCQPQSHPTARQPPRIPHRGNQDHGDLAAESSTTSPDHKTKSIKLWLKVCGAFLQTTHRWLEPKWHHILTNWNTTPNWEPSHKNFSLFVPLFLHTKVFHKIRSLCTSNNKQTHLSNARHHNNINNNSNSNSNNNNDGYDDDNEHRRREQRSNPWRF